MLLLAVRKVFGQFIDGFSSETSHGTFSLKRRVGSLVFRELKFNSDAFKMWVLPMAIKSSFIGTVTLKLEVPSWREWQLTILLDQVYILAGHEEEDQERLSERRFKEKLKQVHKEESATVEAILTGKSWLDSLKSKVISTAKSWLDSNLKIFISNAHIRYEDSVSNRGHPFSSGIIFAKLAALPMDEQGKLVQLEELAVYHDSDCDPWNLDKAWDDLSPKEWVEIFQDGIYESSKSKNSVSPWAQERNYVISPINGVLKYHHHQGNKEREDSDVLLVKASFVITRVSLAITEAQYNDWVKLKESIFAYRKRAEIISRLRPVVPVEEGKALWWRYAAQGGLWQKNISYRFSREKILPLCHLRRKYVQLYADSLQGSTSNRDNSELHFIEKDLDAEVILLWRFLAHAKVESIKSKDNIATVSGPVEEMLVVNKLNSQLLSLRPVRKMDVEMDYPLLELCYGADKGLPLARVILEGLWISYRTTSLSEAELYITLPRFSILDVRPDTKAEMSLMLGWCTDGPKQMAPEHNVDLPNATMFLLDGRWGLSAQSFEVHVQQPRVVVVPDFLLAVYESFVPALGTITSQDSSNLEELSHASDNSGTVQCEFSATPSLRFQVQVVSPEFTFYDSSKSFLDDSSHGEKLLRAKTDLSFMCELKGDDRYIEGHANNLTVVAGSGFVILHPVDLSMTYTIKKGEWNILILTTNINAHFSLGVISLLINLQSQASAASRFGNTDPFARCTKFDRIWVSPKENGHLSNLTFWRPRAPSNYVVLADCVTSRPGPPSQSVMAVSSANDCVRKPLGFNFIGLCSSILGSNTDNDCSLWLPIPPSGYLALGCVAHIGSQPPPNHIIHCVRADLVTQTTVLECLLNCSAKYLIESGFSIWRINNCLGSFIARPSADCPSKDCCFDLNRLQWNSSYCQGQSSPSESLLELHSEQETSLQSTNQSETSSDRDIIRSISKPSAHYMAAPNFELVWLEEGGNGCKPFSIWRPIPNLGYAILGDCITEGLEPPPLGFIIKDHDPEISAKPSHFEKVTHIGERGQKEAFIWKPVAPPGYAAVGYMVTLDDHEPFSCSIACPIIGLVIQASIAEVPISKSPSSARSNRWSIWKVENQACTFLACPDHEKPLDELGFAVCDSVKPKTRDNAIANMKIRYSPMTPLLDATITDFRLEGYGSPDTMSVVLSSSFAASTFNIHFEAWEPLVEPFTGKLLLETCESNPSQPERIAKRMEVAATTIINVNLSASNFDTLAQATDSWRKHRELEEKAIRSYEEAAGPDESAHLAFGENNCQTVIVKNKLGCDVYLKTRDDNHCEAGNLLPDNGDATLCIPRPRYSYRLNGSDESRKTRCYARIQIVEAKGLPLVDDGHSHRYFCALDLGVEKQEIFRQRARTKCVKAVTIKTNDIVEGTAEWNELFIFECSRYGSAAKLEMEVRNLDAKDGEGKVVGACSISVRPGRDILRSSASHEKRQKSAVQSTKSYRLTGQNIGEIHSGSSLLVSISFIEKTMVTDFANKQGVQNDLYGDEGLVVALGPESTMIAGFHSSLPLSVIAGKLEDNFLALDVSMKNGEKHAVLRGLAMVTNNSDITLEISTCQELVNSSRTSVRNVFVEEIFENQQYRPESGWCNDVNNGPRRWITPEFSFSSREFFEPPLPGWEWASTWTVDKSPFVDTDGWAYGPDHHSLTWPLSSPKGSKSSCDAVRRRRWTRTRQEIEERAIKDQNFLDITLCPGGSTFLPWRSMFRDSSQCLQIRPSSDDSQISYAWGRRVSVEKDSFLDDETDSLYAQSTLTKHVNKDPTSPLRLHQLEKKDLLWCCLGSDAGLYWLSIGTDASVLKSDLNGPVYDWKISATAPLRLENRLPCSTEFKIWERLRDGKNIERQQGSLSARGTIQVSSADIRNPIYIMLSLDSGWVMEKVLILDLACGQHVSSFPMVHQQSKRTLLVNIERDLGRSTAAPKIIRFSIPCWINNDSSLSLAYRVVEIESSQDMDSLLDSTSSTSISSASKYSSTSLVLEAIEDTSPIPSMFSPHAYIGRDGVSLFSSQNDMYLSPKLGIAVALQNSDNFSPGVSFLLLAKKQRVDMRALNYDGTYYKLSAVLHMTSDGTRVVHFQPHTIFINRVGCSVCVQQCDTKSLEWLHPTEPLKLFRWQSGVPELIKLRMDGRCQWSAPFAISSEGMMSVCLKNGLQSEYMDLSIEVRGGAKTSHYEVILRPSSSSPYRIENNTLALQIQFRQVNGSNDSWRSLLPNAATSFSWENLGRKRYLELLIDGDDPLKSLKYDIDEIKDHQPIQVAVEPGRNLRVNIIREEKVNVVKIRLLY